MLIGYRIPRHRVFLDSGLPIDIHSMDAANGTKKWKSPSISRLSMRSNLMTSRIPMPGFTRTDIMGLDLRFGHHGRNCRVGTGFIVPTKPARMEPRGWWAR